MADFAQPDWLADKQHWSGYPVKFRRQMRITKTLMPHRHLRLLLLAECASKVAHADSSLEIIDHTVNP